MHRGCVEHAAAGLKSRGAQHAESRHARSSRARQRVGLDAQLDAHLDGHLDAQLGASPQQHGGDVPPSHRRRVAPERRLEHAAPGPAVGALDRGLRWR